ncbi:RHS repeat-associated core domain protein [Citrobacter youngae ATCC 29220]|uniref:RHS repeat-associated core domain protein n=1 Tax=Citrobacter youngae ATCC 29220 TaxID=500640 RepID=D4BEG2_9ENTR|nr:RHS repeat-associated core domain protein [Citrobacter youngae ATCC 29220]
MKDNNRLHTAGQSRNVPKLMVLLCGLEKELRHAEHDEWGNVLREDNPHNLQQLIRLPGQQYDEESGLHYNRHRYYNPGTGRYIT